MNAGRLLKVDLQPLILVIFFSKPERFHTFIGYMRGNMLGCT
jgi:hypothetical protein